MRFLAEVQVEQRRYQTERKAIVAAREDLWEKWEASDGKDEESLQLGWILAYEPSLEELGWCAEC